MWLHRALKITGFMLLAAVLLVSCQKEKSRASGGRFERYGMGDVRDVVVVADSADIDVARSLASVIGADTFYTPHPEPLFFVRVVDLRLYQDSLRGFRNTIVLAVDGSASESLIKEAFGEHVSHGIHFKKEALEEGGYMVGIYEHDGSQLRAVVKDSAEAIKLNLLARAYTQYKRMAYFAGVRKDIPKELMKNYGFTLKLPNGFAYAVQDSHFVCLAKHYPDRFMFFYIENKPRELDPDAMIGLRDSLTKKYYEGDYALKKYCVAERDTFLGFDAVKVTGPWQNDSLVMGGPFRFYAFNADGRFYMVDMAVYAPEKVYKLDYIMRMETIVRTMRLK